MAFGGYEDTIKTTGKHVLQNSQITGLKRTFLVTGAMLINVNVFPRKQTTSRLFAIVRLGINQEPRNCFKVVLISCTNCVSGPIPDRKTFLSIYFLSASSGKCSHKGRNKIELKLKPGKQGVKINTKGVDLLFNLLPHRNRTLQNFLLVIILAEMSVWPFNI